MRRIFRDNGLSIVLFVGFFFTLLVGQTLTGHQEYNSDQEEHGRPGVTYLEYLGTGHFLEATAENWESEFFQMGFYVVLTIFLYQKGSSESKEPGKKEEVDRDPRQSKNKKDAPWPVRKGGLVLKLYENSLSITLFLLFLISFYLHAVGGASEYNQEQLEHGKTEVVTTMQYMGTSRFWFESLQNWQSEFLAIFAMVFLTIFLRQKGSPESKPVDAPHSQTGSD
jgi:hypothetical protein